MKYLFAIGLLCALLTRDAAAQEVVTASAQSAPSEREQADRIRQVIRSLGPRPSTPAQLVQLARDLPPETAASLFLRIGEEYLCSGHWDLGAIVLRLVLEQYPDESAASEATLLLVRLYSSSEVASTHRRLHDTVEELHLPPGWTEHEPTAAADPQDTGMQQYALFLANDQVQKHPALAENSPLAFQCSVAARLSGQTPLRKSWLTLVKHKREAAEWRTRAKAEDWLEELRRGEPPLPTIYCSRTEQSPHLDGNLDEPCWQNATSTISQSEFHLAYDTEYLYLAVGCRKVAGVAYEVDERPRTYDADLTGHDQVRLWLDVDRDYSTWFRWAVDHRGWTGDQCWLDAGWNPKWFVAAGGDESSWTAEAAIPWSELAAQPPRAGAAWAFGAERIPPDAQTEFSPSAPPKEFRLLLFE